MKPEFAERLRLIFEQVVELPEGEQEARLHELCGQDEDLLRQVRALLQAYKQSPEFLETPVVPPENLPPVPDAPRRLGPYRLIEKIGEGGMGHVYLAERADDFTQKVALKIIKRGMDTEALLRRFRRERQILANLTHPNIARLLDGGSTEDGLPYLVMEYIEGLPITEYCDRHKLTVPERLRLFAKVCSAVSFAHKNLVIHRDIKPSNIIVTEEGEPKLLDFGIAKLLHAEEDQPQEQTLPGAQALTPEYASPEQIRHMPVATATDVYSLGILLYTLLAGRRPYHFDDRSPSTIEKVITTTIPTPPSAALKTGAVDDSRKISELESLQQISRLRGVSPEKLRRQLQGDLDNIILKALQKEPERRYASVDQFLEDITRYLAGRPVQARKDTLGYRAAKFINRHRLGVATATLVLLIALFAVAGVVWQGQLARREAAKTQQTLEFVKKMLAAADPLETGKELSVVQLLDEAGKRIDKELQGQPEIEAEIRSILGQAYQNLGHYDKAGEHLRANLQLLRGQYGDRHSLVANATRELAVLEHYQGNLHRADSLYRRALTLYEKIGETGSGDYSVALNDFGTILLDQAQYDSAIVVFNRSLTIMRRAFGENHHQLGSVLNNLAFAYDDRGDYKNADRIYNDALRVFRHNYGEEHPEIANTLNNYAFVKLNVGDTLSSLAMHRQALAMWRKLLGDDHPNIGLTLHNIASVTFYQGDFAQAEAQEWEVVEIFRRHYPADHIYLGSVYFMMGRILNAQGKYAEAEGFLSEALTIRRARLAPDHPATAGVYLELAQSLLAQNRLKEAETALQTARTLFTTPKEPNRKALEKIAELEAELRGKRGGG